jgi:competence protein ComEC
LTTALLIAHTGTAWAWAVGLTLGAVTALAIAAVARARTAGRAARSAAGWTRARGGRSRVARWIRIVVPSRSRGAPVTAFGGILCLCCTAAALSATAVAVWHPVRQPADSVAASGHVVTVAGTVLSGPVRVAGVAAFGDAEREYVALTAARMTIGDRTVVGGMPVRAYLPGGTPLQPGEKIELTGTLHVRGQEESTAFNLYASASPHHTAPPPLILEWANGLRTGFARVAARLPGDGGALLPGLAIGDVHAVSDDLDSAMKASSLSHLTAVSGSNCAVVIALVMLIARLARLSRMLRAAVALTALGAFVVLVTPQPSVVRAAVMATIVVFAHLGGRTSRGVPALAVATIALLVADPWMSRNAGFALSVLATGGLLLLAPALGRRLRRFLPEPLALAIAIPLAAQLACQPVLLTLNPSLPLYGVVANMLAEPTAAPATVLGLVGCLLTPLSTGLGFAFAQVAWLPSAWIAAVARATSALPGSQVPWLSGTAGVIAMTAGTLCVVLLLTTSARHRRLRLLVAALLVAALTCYGGAVTGLGIGRSVSTLRDWGFAACDIGQGDAVLIRSGSAHALVDVGPDPAALQTCLERLQIDRIDLLVLTHYDLDHVGGVQAVLGKVGAALVGPDDDPRSAAIVRQLTSHGASVRHAARGDHGTLGNLRWSVLWPEADTPLPAGNEQSVTLSVHGRLNAIFLGDLDERAQRELLSDGVEPVDLVKVAHHGSADQSEALYDALRARVALISVGAGNDYGHPTARLLGILQRAGTAYFRTDDEGIVLVGAGENGTIRAWTERTATRDRLRTPGSAVRPSSASRHGASGVGGGD